MKLIVVTFLSVFFVSCFALRTSPGTYTCETGDKCAGSKNVGTVHGVEYCCKAGDSMSLHTENVTGFAKTWCHCVRPPHQCLKNDECSRYDVHGLSTFKNDTYCCGHGEHMSMSSIWVNGHEWVECYCGTSVTTADVQIFGDVINDIVTNLSRAFWADYATQQNLATLLSIK